MTKEVGNSNLLDTWAANGTIVEPSEAKKDNGWDLGEQPPHEYANWVLNVLGKAVNHVLQNGVPAWNAATAYAANNFVSRSGTIYVAKQANTNSEPPNANWQAVAPYSAHWSVEYLAGFLQLKGDVQTPGNNKIYGTDGSGNRGWQPAPVQADGFKTGDIKLKYANAEESGFVRLNGGTIGNAASAATERANADTEALFLYLWGADANLVVSGGRGASAAADYAANKRLTLPDARGRALVGIDGMGEANTDRLTTDYGAFDGTVLGASGGEQAHSLTEAENGEHTHDFGSGQPNIDTNGTNVDMVIFNSGGNNPQTTFESGEGAPHNNVQPSLIIGTVYIKL